MLPLPHIRDILNWAYDYKENYIDGWELVFDSLLAKFKMFYSKYKDIRCPKCKSLVVYDLKSIRGIDSFVCTKCDAGIDIPWWLIFDASEEVM